ncbi:methylenetetrahydrofolate--tRNA-(uracil(54)-C(5))-methyltransferase (FADH(2)-oxidizing) TrmFO [Sandaracinus amylolyticus]|uniref:methylenetetrahydrofolate--tRNA-(uracil(54)- C(5))-methyltransferase (FADH(2)-oxidizing) TrmFO n=1 Tax=Sandaracinus amylolyticus TaxID=927083 RepID=UPI001F39FDB0|nr:methylenetetrahydrofolate--tRNA-(uracil(54)-C(5))-methyltransferase (FADH(2)-oxidizing) TrmFO [Sandaracinus amylolyticus]UJR78222.1 Methylenetetrahydrofolate--tRNA-(uracil-5-)-methyltransferase TrmFO [Sandaracinus amylolyticus]
MPGTVTIVGGGLAGCECAWQLAERGVDVVLIEQKPLARTPAQTGDGLAELVCSNSFRGAALSNAVGLLKEEMRRAGSLVMASGALAQVPAGGAFAVDREVFSREMTQRVHAHPRIRVEHAIVDRVPDARPLVLATGPLTGESLAADLSRVIGGEHLAYYDAIAPIVSADSIDESKTFRASRYDKGGDDAYLNCPLTKDEYERFVQAVIDAEKVAPRAFEEPKYFEGCLPLEVMAERGMRTLAFGPMKPVGLTDPRTGRWPYAVVQLRAEDVDFSAYNLVGFQTRMKHADQKRVFSMIPGLENVEIVRYGSVHRNTFVDSPRVLDDSLALRALPGVHLAGQISGVEGYVESAACGLVLGVLLAGGALPPETTALGSLYRHLRRAPEGKQSFQPSNVVFSMFPSLGDAAVITTPTGKFKKLGKRERGEALAMRALADLDGWLDQVGAREVHARVAPRESVAIEASAG